MSDVRGNAPRVEPGPEPATRRTASGEFGRLVDGAASLFDFARPLVFAAGLGLALAGLGRSLESDKPGGPETMGFGGILVGLALPAWRRPR